MLAGHFFLVFVLLTSSVLCLEPNRGISVEYHKDIGAITVQINANHFNSSSYQLELSMNGCSEQNKTILKKAVFYPLEVAQMKFDGPFTSSLYCVLVTPLNMLNKTKCQTPCQPVFQEVNINSQAVFKKRSNWRANATDKLNCFYWDSLTRIEPEGNHDGTYKIRVGVNIVNPFKSCFTNINISLWDGVYETCNSLSGQEVDQKTVKVAPDLEGTAVFEDLKSGSYCIRLYAFHSSCGGSCEVRRSDAMSLPNITSEVVGPFSSSVNTEGSSLIYILAGCVIFILIIVAVLTWYCKRLHTHFPISVNERGLTLTDLIELAKLRARKLEVVLLYSQDFEEHSDVVLALYHFLLKCFHVSSVRFYKEEEPFINVNLHSWVENILRRNENRVFMVVESEGAVLQEDGRRKLKLLRPVNEDCLDDVFPYALQLLKNGTRGLCDYKTVFVVKFGYTPDDLRLNCMVPNCRYTLPKHLFDLYCTLLDLPFRLGYNCTAYTIEVK